MHSPQVWAALGCRVVVVAAGSPAGAVNWQQETGVPCEIYVDQDRQLYKSLNLDESISKVWNMSTMVYYAEQMAAQRPLHQVVSGDNIHQMGGDFVLNDKCELIFAYRSQTPPERPTIEQLEQEMRKAQK